MLELNAIVGHAIVGAKFEAIAEQLSHMKCFLFLHKQPRRCAFVSAVASTPRHFALGSVVFFALHVDWNRLRWLSGLGLEDNRCRAGLPEIISGNSLDADVIVGVRSQIVDAQASLFRRYGLLA